MHYEQAYKLASWICLNHARDVNYVASRFPDVSADDVYRVIRCVSNDCQMIDLARLNKLFLVKETK